MKPLVNAAVLAVLLAVIPGRCHALWDVEQVSKERAKELGVVIRSTSAGPNDITIELELKTGGKFKGMDRVDLRIGTGTAVVTAALREDRSKQGRVTVSFTANRGQLGNINLCVMVPGGAGGEAYVFRAKDFIEIKKD